MLHNDTHYLSHLPWDTLSMPLVSLQLSQCLPQVNLPMKSLSRTFPVVLVPAATWLTSSWSFLRQRRSLFSDSTWASRSDLHRFSSPRIPRRPLMSFSTSWRRDSSLSYLSQQEKERGGTDLAKHWPECWGTGWVTCGLQGAICHNFPLHHKWWRVQVSQFNNISYAGIIFSLTGAIIIFKLDLKLNLQNVHLKYNVV